MQAPERTLHPGASLVWDNRFEIAISRTAQLAVRGAGRGVAVEVLCRGSRSPLLAPGAPADPVLRFLALLQPVPAEADLPFAPRSRFGGRFEVAVGPERTGDEAAAPEGGTA